MAFTQVFVLVILTFAVDALKWKNCGGERPVQIRDIRLSPYPLPLKEGAKVTVSGKFAVTGNAGTKYKINLKFKKHLGWFGWTAVPCFGKCTRNIACQQMISLLDREECPLSPRQEEYVVKPRTETLPALPLPSKIKRGKYKVTADLRDRANNGRIACVEVEMEIKSSKDFLSDQKMQ